MSRNNIAKKDYYTAWIGRVMVLAWIGAMIINVKVVGYTSLAAFFVGVFGRAWWGIAKDLKSSVDEWGWSIFELVPLVILCSPVAIIVKMVWF